MVLLPRRAVRVAVHQLARAGSLKTDGNDDRAGEPHRPAFGLGVEEHCALPARRDGFDTRRPNQFSPSVVSTAHAGLLTRAVVVRVHPEGPPLSPARRIPASRPSQHGWDHSEGTRGRWGGRFVVSEEHDGFESRASRQNGFGFTRASVAEGRDGDLGSLISSSMRVRFPPPRP